MIVNGLTAAMPICKSYELVDGVVKKTPYPFVYEFTSGKHDVQTLTDLKLVIENYAKVDGCLVKGVLQRDLVSESRQGATDGNTLTEWVCLDLDGIEQFQTVDEFLDKVGAGDVDYVLQWSNSMGIENKAGFRCHIFMFLAEPAGPPRLKTWLQYLNLTVPQLHSQLELTKTGVALRWPLDVSTCQNDKLIYVSSPKLGAGISDPFPNGTRISIHIKNKRRLSLPPDLPSKMRIQQMIDARVMELREASGLPKRKSAQYKVDSNSGVEYVANPEAAEITEMKVERGFVYFNLNGGDSWAYYHPVDKPFYIYNFKGEAVYRTQDLLPKYWADLAKVIKSGAPDSAGVITLAFRDFPTDTYYNGTYDTNTNRLDLSKTGSKDKLKDFLKDNGKPVIDVIPDWEVMFDPNMPETVDSTRRIVNTYQPSEFFRITKPEQVLTAPPVCHRVISHALGNNPQVIDHFYNWLACIVQFKRSTLTAWILHGTQGTGKGVMFHHILKPIFGMTNVTMMRAEELTSEFTGRFDNKFLVFIDEIQAESSNQFQRVMARLKSMITEPVISIRNMYAEAKEKQNYCNFLFSSNMPEPITISEGDRRFNVAVYQPNKIDISFADFDAIKDELPQMYAFLVSYAADPLRARTVIQTADRTRIIALGVQSAEEVTVKLLSGDLRYFVEGISNAPSMKRKFQSEDYTTIVKDIVTNLPPALTRDQLQTIFLWLCGQNIPDAPYKFATFLRHKGIELEPTWVTDANGKGSTKRALRTVWQYDQTWLDGVRLDIQNGEI